jgi:UDP-galactopyranose mutase
MGAIARALRDVGPEYPFIFLPYGEASWQFANLANFGEMLPYIDNLNLREVYDLEKELPIPVGQTKRFVVQLERRSTDVPMIQRFHPHAIVKELKDLNNKVVAILVTAAG